MEAERRQLEAMAAMTPEQRREKEILDMQSKLTEEQQVEIQGLVAAVVGGQELSVEQQNILKTYLTPGQLEEVRLQMVANLEKQKLELQHEQQQQQLLQQQQQLLKQQQTSKTAEEDALAQQLKAAAARTAELEAEMKKHEQEMKSFMNATSAAPVSPRKLARENSNAPSFPAAFEMDPKSVADPFEALPAPRKSKKSVNTASVAIPGQSVAPVAAAPAAAAASSVAPAPPPNAGWKAQFTEPEQERAPEPPKKAPVSSGISAEERKRQIEAEVRKRIEEETRSKIEAEKKRIEEEVRRKLEAEARAKMNASRPAVVPARPVPAAAGLFDDVEVVVEGKRGRGGKKRVLFQFFFFFLELEQPAPKKLSAPPPPPVPPRDDEFASSGVAVGAAAVAPPPPPPSRPAPPPPAAMDSPVATSGKREGCDVCLVALKSIFSEVAALPPVPPRQPYRNPFEEAEAAAPTPGVLNAPSSSGTEAVGRSLVAMAGWLHKKVQDVLF